MILNPGQSLQSFIEPWFKPSAYSLILLRQDGYPCVFYGDFYGITNQDIPPVSGLQTLMELRKEKAYGIQHDYFDHPHTIGWTLEGDEEHLSSGLATLITNQGEAEKRMYVGENHQGEKWIDALNNCQQEIWIDDQGYGNFKVVEKSVSVWVSS